MSKYNNLKEEFDKKVEELRKNCKHEKLSEWMEEWWAVAHPTGYMVKTCRICNQVIERKTACFSCGEEIDSPENKTNRKHIWIERDGHKFCSDYCIKKHKEQKW